MKIISPSVQFFGAVPTDYYNALRFIEMAGRTCYKSEDKITEDSAEKFVKKLIKAGHLAMVEHSNFVVQHNVPSQYRDPFLAINFKYLNTVSIGNTIYIGGNLRAWAEHTTLEGIPDYCEPFIKSYGKLFNINYDDLSYNQWQVCPHDEIPHSLHRYSVRFICDRGVSHELVRHRPCSFAQESTRYVNYKGKDMEFIEPVGFDKGSNEERYSFLRICELSEVFYNKILDDGKSPQQARAVLPNMLKTEIIVTADIDEWTHIRKLRTDKAAHPDMQRLMNMMPWEEFL